MILAIDPGRDKCGVVVINRQAEIKYQRVIETSKLKSIVNELVNEFEVERIILGDGTTSQSAQQTLEIFNISIQVVNEKHTTEEARKLYWKKNPPKGLRRLLPTSIQVPPQPVDDLVAEILAERFLRSEINEST